MKKYKEYILSDDDTILLDILTTNSELILPDSVTKMAKNDYTLINLKSLICPNVINIDARTFDNSGLEYISLPLITEIKDYTFNNCINLKSINIPNVEIIYNRAFFDCHSLEYIETPHLRIVYNGSFYNCHSLKYINAPLLSNIGYMAFYCCENLYYIKSELNNEQIINSFTKSDYETYLMNNRDYKLKDYV